MMLKDPDGVIFAVSKAVRDELEKVTDISDGERRLLQEGREEEFRFELSRWIQYDEFVEIEFDTENKTARVIPNGE